MDTEHTTPKQEDLPPGWTVPQPAELPEPSIWPAALSLAIMFIVWGLVSSLIISGIGLVLFAVSMIGWIREIRHERAKHGK